MTEKETMPCMFCKGTGKIKKKLLMPDPCLRCGGPVFLHEFKVSAEIKSYQYVCYNCGTIAQGITDLDHDLTNPKMCALYRGDRESYVRIMKERFNIEVK